MAALPDSLLAGALELRRGRTSHLVELMAAIERSQQELACWLPWADPLPSDEAELEFLIEYERAFEHDLAYSYFLFERDSGELVGGMGLHLRGQDRRDRLLGALRSHGSRLRHRRRGRADRGRVSPARLG